MESCFYHNPQGFDQPAFIVEESESDEEGTQLSIIVIAVPSNVRIENVRWGDQLGEVHNKPWDAPKKEED